MNACEVCSKPCRRRFCSQRCGATARNGGPTVSAYPGLASGTVGAISELLVSADLLRRGYAVFRALSAACPCDLAVLKGTTLIRVEVKTSYRYRGKLMRPTLRTDNFDVLAICIGAEIVYEVADRHLDLCADLLA